MDYKYKYIYFNYPDDYNIRDTRDGYYSVCIRDLEKLKDVQVVYYPLCWASKLIKLIFRIHHSAKLNKIINLPFKKKWYPYYFKEDTRNNKPYCFIINNYSIPVDYFYFLKDRYPMSKVVLIHRDLISVFKRNVKQYTEKVIDEIVDYRLSYDANDAKKNNCVFFDEFESKLDIEEDNDIPRYDVFFAGRAKDRLPKLLELYHVLTSAGLECHYCLTGVPKEEQVQLEGIEYLSENIVYKDLLKMSVNARILIEINQGGAVGYTSRFLEAVMYNKYLITDNPWVKESKFYNPNYILYFDELSSLDTDYVKSRTQPIDYNYNSEFSPIHLIDKIELLLEDSK